jgi:hypothetical protein
LACSSISRGKVVCTVASWIAGRAEDGLAIGGGW